MASPLFSCTLDDMYTSFCKPKLSSCAGFVVKVRNLGNCQLGFSQYGGSKVLSTTTRKNFSLEATGKSVSVVEDVEEHSFTVSYLINSCGLSPELAISASKKVNFTTPDKPDSVLALLRDYGFRSTHIAELVRRAPGLLLARPETTLIPKLEFFRSMGIPDYELPGLCSLFPNMLRYGLKQRIIPCCGFLESVLLVDKKVVASVLKGGPRIFDFDVRLRLAPNVEILRQMGVTPSVISHMLITYPALLNMKHDKFTEGASELIRLGFKPSRLSFAQALYATTMMGRSKWEKKVKIFKSWGCSDDDVSHAFRKFPLCMLVSEKKIMHGMEFLVNELGLEPTEVLRNPILFCYSLKKRVIPRYSVVRVLQLKGLLNKGLCLASSIYPSEKHFLEKYVTKYKEQVPQLLSVYQGRVRLRELGFGPEHIQRIANTSLSR